MNSSKLECNSLKCRLCEKQFKSKSHFNRHISAVHEGKKPFACNKCDAKFADRSNLKRHILSVHEEKLKCSYGCGAKFSKEIDLNKHIASFHECKICGVKYVKKKWIRYAYCISS